MNVTSEEAEEASSEYAGCQPTCTGHRTALYVSSVLARAADFARSNMPIFEVSTECALLWMLKTGRYYFDDKFAMSCGTYHPVYAYMCASTSPVADQFVYDVVA